MRVEWRAALDQFRTEVSGEPAANATFSFAIQQRFPASEPRSIPALVQLNAITSEIFNGIGRSPIPVLLPFDTTAWLEARQNHAADLANLAHYQADFRPVDVFHAGLSGYDATFSLAPPLEINRRKCGQTRRHFRCFLFEECERGFLGTVNANDLG